MALAVCHASLAACAGRCASEGADKTQPVHIVEVGAGHGKMAFLMVTKLLELREFFPVERPFKYVMTDFTQASAVARPAAGLAQAHL